MTKGTCYIAGVLEDLYYLSTSGRWYLYDEDTRRLRPTSAPKDPRLAPDEAERLADEDQLDEEARHQAAVRAAVAAVEPPVGPLFHAPRTGRADLRLLN